MDALLACKAAMGRLKASEIEAMCAAAPTRAWLGWTLGLEWARHLMPEEEVLGILEQAFAGCDDADLAAAMALETPSQRLIALRGFLLGPRDVWPLSRKFVLRRARRRTAVSDYVRVLWCTLLVRQADDGGGKYPLDGQVVGFMTEASTTPCRALSYYCKVLTACEPSERYEEWERFLCLHAANVGPRDLSRAEYMIGRIWGPKGPGVKGVYDRPIRAYGGVTEPGVHMRGFRWAGR
jgi:hypothetical protein